MFEKINALYVLISTIIGGVGTVITWRIKSKADARKAAAAELQLSMDQAKAESESSEVMIAALESLKKKVVDQTLREVRLTTLNAEKTVLIERLRLHCPDCYNSFMKKLNSNGS